MNKKVFLLMLLTNICLVSCQPDYYLILHSYSDTTITPSSQEETLTIEGEIVYTYSLNDTIIPLGENVDIQITEKKGYWESQDIVFKGRQGNNEVHVSTTPYTYSYQTSTIGRDTIYMFIGATHREERRDTTIMISYTASRYFVFDVVDDQE